MKNLDPTLHKRIGVGIFMDGIYSNVAFLNNLKLFEHREFLYLGFDFFLEVFLSKKFNLMCARRPTENC